MEVLNAACLTPSLHKTTTTTERSRAEPRRLFPFRFLKDPISTARSPSLTDLLSRGFGGGLAVLSSALGTGGLAKALTYEEALGQTVSAASSSSEGSVDFNIGGFFDGILQFGSENALLIGGFFDGILKLGSENALLIGGGTAVLAVPLVLSQILKDPKPWGIETAKNAYSKLSDDATAQLLDIREGREFKEVGSPDLKSIKKKAVSIAYRGDDKSGFLKKLALKFKDPASTTLFILDKFDGNSELVAEQVTANGFKAAFAIKDGAEGARGWQKSGLPWSPPKKALSVDFDDLKDAITSALGDSSDSLPVTLGLAAATGLGVFAVSEIETLLQILGSAALIQLLTKKLLFAKDRKVTLQQVDEFLNTKIAPKGLVDEIKMIGKALLPVPVNAVASLPVPTNVNTETSSSAETVQAATEPPPTVNSVPKVEVEEESVPVLPRPLSPYPYYPEFRPPSSPSPSPP